MAMETFNQLSPFNKAFALTTLISVAPTLVLLLIPFGKGGGQSSSGIPPGLHKALLSFAAGGLLGDVFLHSIPHLLMEHGHDHGDHDHNHDHEDAPLLSRQAADHDHDHDHDHDRDHDHDHDHDHEEAAAAAAASSWSS